MKGRKTVSLLLVLTLIIAVLPVQVFANGEVEETDYTIKFKVTSDWGQAFNGEISITNNTEETIEDWMLEFFKIGRAHV